MIKKFESKSTFMRDDEILLVAGNGLVEDMWIIVFVRRSEMILMKFDRHPDSGRDNFPQQLHVSEDPLVTDGRDPEVTLEECVKAVQEKLNCKKNVAKIFWFIISKLLQFGNAYL